ncbi:MAG: hypothetical protein AAGG02_06360 [Cyanobacteria bacterium P01_H01_bin.15]
MELPKICSNIVDLLLAGLLIFTVFWFVKIWLTAGEFELSLLDFIWNPSEARELIAHLDPTQRQAHIWITENLDVILPLSYGVLFAGSVWRFYPLNRAYFAVPALLAVGADLIEGRIQILALKGTTDLLNLKQFITPFKFGMVLLAIIIASCGFTTYFNTLRKNRRKTMTP